MKTRARERGALAALLMAALVAATGGTALSGSAEARDWHPPRPAERQLTVMTQNLYLGSSLTPALEASTPEQLVAAVAQIYGTAVFTDFPRRAEAVADTIASERPDLIGLQEVTRWSTQRTTAGPLPPGFDFLEILQDALRRRGLDYTVSGVSENADIGPAPLVSPTFGCAPPASPAAVPDCLVSLRDRDVILTNDDNRRLHLGRPRHGAYRAQEELALPGSPPVSIARGWTYVDGRFRGRRFRFVNTHLEGEQFAATQVAQARELLAGPGRTRRSVIAVGDFNSAADPSTTSTPTATYRVLTRPWRFRDAWSVNGSQPGLTCCQTSALANPASVLRTRIDLVLARGSVRSRSAHVVGDAYFPGALAPPFWASDHAGVVATMRLY